VNCNKSRLEYTFFSRDELVELLKIQYFQLKNKNLPIYGVKVKNLKDYLTSERDLMRGQTKVPLKFRLWEKDIDRGEFQKGYSFIGGSTFDTEFYKQQALNQNPKIGEPMEETKAQDISNPNSSVLGNDLSKKDRASNRNLDKYNKKEKLEKEEKSMEGS